MEPRTYKERINRFVVEAMDTKLDERTRAEYRINGIDPDDYWRLIWSFDDLGNAEEQAMADNERWGDLRTYRVRDLGETKYVERSIW